MLFVSFGTLIALPMVSSFNYHLTVPFYNIVSYEKKFPMETLNYNMVAMDDFYPSYLGIC